MLDPSRAARRCDTGGNIENPLALIRRLVHDISGLFIEFAQALLNLPIRPISLSFGQPIVVALLHAEALVDNPIRPCNMALDLLQLAVVQLRLFLEQRAVFTRRRD